MCLRILTEIITHPQDKSVPFNSRVTLMCTSSISSNVTFSWSRNGRSIGGLSTTDDTSILTITSVRDCDAGSYVCTVSSGSLSVVSNTATLTLKGNYTLLWQQYNIKRQLNLKLMYLHSENMVFKKQNALHNTSTCIAL